MWKSLDLSPGFVFHQLEKYCMNTCTQYMSANITLPPQEQFLSAQHRHVDTAIANAILEKKVGSFHQWTKDDCDLAVTVIQKPHAQGGFGITPNVLAQTSAKVAMASRFLALVGDLCLWRKKNSGFLIRWYMTRIRGPLPIYST